MEENAGERDSRSRWWRYTPLPRFGRWTLVAVVLAGIIAELIISLSSDLRPSSYPVNIACIAIIALFAWKPPSAALCMLAGIPISAALDSTGFYGVALAIVSGLVIYACALWLALAYCLISAVWLVLSEVLYDDIATGGAMSTIALGAVSALVGYSMRASRIRTHSIEADNRRLTTEAEQAITAERDRIADELHNIIAHELTVVALQARALPLAPDEEERKKMTQAIITSSDQALTDLRRMLRIVQNRESSADETSLGLPPVQEALEGDAAQLRELGIKVDLHVASQVQASKMVNTTLVHIASECVTNILKHARATPSVDISIQESDDSFVMSFVNDTPLKEDPAQDHSGGYGLRRMTDRVNMLGGSLTVEHSFDRWHVRAVVPRA